MAAHRVLLDVSRIGPRRTTQHGAVYGVCMEPVARMGMRSGELRWRISGVRTGKRELVAEYESRPV